MIGNNTGNRLFQTSVARVVMTEDCEVNAIRFSSEIPNKDVEYYNSEYDAFVIPLANAFRAGFVKELHIMTNFIRRLTIPCVVIGVGTNKAFGEEDRWEYGYDEDVKEFMNAVLEKSAIVGLRGEVTAEYLKRMGYRPEKDFTVIGCPSMFVYGDALPKLRLKELTPQSNVAYNFKGRQPRPLYEFLRGEAKRFDHSIFVSQILKEIETMYAGTKYPESMAKYDPADYPTHFSDPLMRGTKMRGVLDVKSWLDFMSKMDLNFGGRIHGDLVSLLAGTPCYIIAGEYRIKELADYFQIPNLSMYDIKDDTNIFDLYEKADYSGIYRNHAKRLTHYLDFLDVNGVKHVSREVLSTKDTPFDCAFKEFKPLGMITPFPEVDLLEQERRLNEFDEIHKVRYENLRVMKNDRIEELKGQVSDRQAKIKQLQEEKKEKSNEIMQLKKHIKWMESSKFWRMKLKIDKITGHDNSDK